MLSFVMNIRHYTYHGIDVEAMNLDNIEKSNFNIEELNRKC